MSTDASIPLSHDGPDLRNRVSPRTHGEKSDDDQRRRGADRRRLGEAGFGCDLWTDPPGQRWEDFTHATDELVTVLEGEMEFEVASQVHHPNPGEELLIPAG